MEAKPETVVVSCYPFVVVAHNPDGTVQVRRPNGKKVYTARRCDPTYDFMYGRRYEMVTGA